MTSTYVSLLRRKGDLKIERIAMRRKAQERKGNQNRNGRRINKESRWRSEKGRVEEGNKELDRTEKEAGARMRRGTREGEGSAGGVRER